MTKRGRIFLTFTAVALLGMNIAGWMRPYAVTGCFLLIGLALYFGGEQDR